MFELPSMWNFVISTLVFFIAAWYIRRYLDEQGLPKGATHSLLVFTLASLVSWGAGDAADWLHDTPPNDLATLLKPGSPNIN
ncbi:MAG: hypothetical protein PHP85_06440 [Gallionella sp.]|nr:hypothetical protein [Gallionella sp.]